MTDDERELLLLNSQLTASLLRDQYIKNMSSAYGNEALEKYAAEKNEALLEQTCRLVALSSRVRDPHVPVDLMTLMLYCKRELLTSIQREFKEAVSLFSAMKSNEIVENLLKLLGLPKEVIEEVGKEQKE